VGTPPVCGTFSDIASLDFEEPLFSLRYHMGHFMYYAYEILIVSIRRLSLTYVHHHLILFLHILVVDTSSESFADQKLLDTSHPRALGETRSVWPLIYTFSLPYINKKVEFNKPVLDHSILPQSVLSSHWDRPTLKSGKIPFQAQDIFI